MTGYNIGVHSVFCVMGYKKGVHFQTPLYRKKSGMAYLKKRGKKWVAVWYSRGKKVARTTGIDVTSQLATARQLKKLAQEVADKMEQAEKGELQIHKALEAVRTASGAAGLAKIPTTREWLEKDLANRRPALLAVARRFCDIIGEDADKPIDRLKPSTIERYYAAEMGNVSLLSLRNYKGLISASFNRAMFDDLIEVNPFTRTRLPKSEHKPHPKKPFTMEQINAMILTFPDPWPALIQVSFLTGGQRLGDVALLKWDQIDFIANTIEFTTQKVRREMKIQMPGILVDLLRKQKNDSQYVFPDAAARYLRRCGYLSNDFSQLVYKAGFVEKPKEKLEGRKLHVNPLTFHSIRHTVVSLLRTSNIFTADLARAIVGHSSESIERAYFHAHDQDLSKGYNYLESLLKK